MKVHDVYRLQRLVGQAILEGMRPDITAAEIAMLLEDKLKDKEQAAIVNRIKEIIDET